MSEKDLTLEELRKLAKSLSDADRELDDFAMAAKDSASIAKKNAAALEAFGGYLGKLGKTVVSNEQGSAKYGAAITGATDTVGDFVGSMGIAGKVIGFFIKQIGGLAAASLKQNDALIKSYRTLSDFGAIDSSGVKGVLDNLLKMGGNSENVENFQRVMKDIAPDMTAFGGTVASGAKKFADTTNVLLTGPLQNSLTQLGYSTDDIVKYSGQFVAMNSKNGMLTGKSTGEVAAQSAAYMKTLSELTMLTGASRDEAAKVMQQQQTELGFRLKMNEIARTDPERAKRLSESIAAVTMTNKDLGSMAMEQIVNDGGVVTEKSAQLMSQFPDLAKQIDEVSRGSGDVALGTMNVLKSQVPNLERIIEQFGATGKISAEGAQALGLNVETLNSLEKIRNTDTAKFNEELKKITGGGDKRLTAEQERVRLEQQSRKGLEQFTFAMGDVAVPVVNSLASVMNKFGKAMAEVVYFITKNIPGMDTIDFRGAFTEYANAGEAMAVINREAKVQQELNAKIKEQDEEMLKIDKDLIAAKARSASAQAGTDFDEMNAAGLEEAALIKRKEKLKEARAKNQGELANSKSTMQGAQAQTSSMSGGAATSGTGDLSGLNIKKGDVMAPGKTVSPKLIELARKIQGSIGDFNYFSGFNDQFHNEKSPKSNHTKGLALDFVLGKDITGDKETGGKIVEQLKSLGAINVIDEYNNPSGKATAGHIHAEVSAKTQGMFKGPESGYWLKAHGEEALMNEQGLTNLITKTQMPGFGTGGDSSVIDTLVEAMSEMATKLESIESILSKSQSTHEQILNYSKV
jgi:hypothetical protein